MQRFPPEVLVQIVNNTDSRENLKALRLVNRKFSGIASKSLFESVVVRYQQHSFEHLNSISSQPTINEYVKRVVYVVDEGIGTCWTQTVDHAVDEAGQPQMLPSVVLFHIPLSAALSTYRTETDERLLHQTLLEEASVLSAAMTNLPNITDMEVLFSTDSPSLSVSSEDEDPLRTFVDNPEQMADDGVRQVSALIRAASISKSSIRNLKILNGTHGVHYHFLEMDGFDGGHADAVFKNLTNIGLEIDTKRGESGSKAVLLKGKLAELLTSAIHLQHLSVGFDQAPDESVGLSCILGTGIWKELKTLELCGLDYHLAELKSFVARHLQMIEIRLIDSHLHTGTFRGLLEALNDMPGLRRVSIDSVLSDSEAVNDFLSSQKTQGKELSLYLSNANTQRVNKR